MDVIHIIYRNVNCTISFKATVVVFKTDWKAKFGTGFLPGYTSCATISFGTLKDVNLQINSSASNNHFNFKNDVSAFSTNGFKRSDFYQQAQNFMKLNCTFAQISISCGTNNFEECTEILKTSNVNINNGNTGVY